jgi:hypothetical protein
MSDGQVAVIVRTITGQPAEAKVTISDTGNLVILAPPPGALILDPVLDWPNLAEIVRLLLPRATQLRDQWRAAREDMS